MWQNQIADAASEVIAVEAEDSRLPGPALVGHRSAAPWGCLTRRCGKTHWRETFPFDLDDTITVDSAIWPAMKVVESYVRWNPLAGAGRDEKNISPSIIFAADTWHILSGANVDYVRYVSGCCRLGEQREAIVGE